VNNQDDNLSEERAVLSVIVILYTEHLHCHTTTAVHNDTVNEDSVSSDDPLTDANWPRYSCPIHALITVRDV